MEALECIARRHSCRNYKEGKIPEEDMKKILEAAFSAPTAMNRRPFELLLVEDPKTLLGLEKFHTTIKVAMTASFVVVVVGDEGKQPCLPFLYEDCGSVSHAMLLAAHALGYAGLWNGVRPEGDYDKALTEHFKIPAEKHPVSVLIFGIPAGYGTPNPHEFDPKKIIKDHF